MKWCIGGSIPSVHPEALAKCRGFAFSGQSFFLSLISTMGLEAIKTPLQAGLNENFSRLRLEGLGPHRC